MNKPKFKTTVFVFCDRCNKFNDHTCNLSDDECISMETRIPDNDSAAQSDYFRSFLFYFGRLGYRSFGTVFLFTKWSVRKAKMFFSIKKTIENYYFEHWKYSDALRSEDLVYNDKQLSNQNKTIENGKGKES